MHGTSMQTHQSCFREFTMQVLHSGLIKGKEERKQQESGLKVAGNQHCSAFVQVLGRFRGVFGREDAVISSVNS